MSKVRRGTLEDIEGIVDFLEEYHKTSNFSDVKFNRLHTASVLEFYAGRLPDHAMWVSENADKKIDGLFAGSLEPYAFNQEKRYGTDLWFIAGKGTGGYLVNRFKRWCKDRGVSRIILAVSSGDYNADKLLEALGFIKTGGMYVLR